MPLSAGAEEPRAERVTSASKAPGPLTGTAGMPFVIGILGVFSRFGFDFSDDDEDDDNEDVDDDGDDDDEDEDVDDDGGDDDEDVDDDVFFC